ncbi:hypothetical protein LOK49_LG04G01831 [Camellia lanceoleosa]|uniref:Uncharacterized protein n=1 Tax=Camellia lanceoleosa TaxID=1840588 RepID=A0ACC0I239_9ERIC|nr:hypothetical protein LOK49_LG04G01831 [Camellia lanceoleosa]
MRARIRTSWTHVNPTRRFLGCPNYGKNGACGFFYWYDPPTCPRGRQVLPKLVDKVASLEEMVTEIARLKEDVQTYHRRQKWIVSGLIVAVIVIGMLTVSS